MVDDEDIPPPPPPRPDDHPADLPWPPVAPVYPADSPAREDKMSTKAFNWGAAVASFGDEFCDKLKGRQVGFRGDWWALAVLMRCEAAASALDPTGNDEKRYAWWGELRGELFTHFNVGLHLEGLNRWGGDLRHINLAAAHLEKCFLLNAKCQGALLEGIYANEGWFHRANFTGALLRGATLTDGHLHGVISSGVCWRQSVLDGTSLEGAELSNADLTGISLVKGSLRGARLTGARVDFANLDSADLRAASFDYAILIHTVFDRADVRGATGLILFDQNPVDRLHIEGTARDPWSILRRTYTGPRYFMHLLLLVAFMLPFVVRVFHLSAIGDAQAAIERAAAAQVGHPWGEQVHAWMEGYEASHEPRRAVWVLVGWTRGWYFAVMTAVVVLYNALRAILTFRVSALRDAEERSKITPSLEDYYGKCHPLSERAIARSWAWPWYFFAEWSRRVRLWWNPDPQNSEPELDQRGSLMRLWSTKGQLSPIPIVGLYRLHLVAQLLFWFAIASLGVQVIDWLVNTTVYLPR